MRWKQGLFTALSVVVSGALLTWYAAHVMTAMARENALELGRAVARQLAQASGYGLTVSDPVVLKELTVATLDGAKGDVLAVAIRDANGRVVAERGRPQAPRVDGAERGPDETPERVRLSERVHGPDGPGGDAIAVVSFVPGRMTVRTVVASMLAATLGLAVVLGASAAVFARERAVRP